MQQTTSADDIFRYNFFLALYGLMWHLRNYCHSIDDWRGPPRGFGEQGKQGIYFRGTGEQRPIMRGTGEQRPNFEGNREHKKTNFRFLGNRGASQFFSGEQGNRYPPSPPLGGGYTSVTRTGLETIKGHRDIDVHSRSRSKGYYSIK